MVYIPHVKWTSLLKVQDFVCFDLHMPPWNHRPLEILTLDFSLSCWTCNLGRWSWSRAVQIPWVWDPFVTICDVIYLLFIFYNDFYFFHYSWFIVFCQFSTVHLIEHFYMLIFIFLRADFRFFKKLNTNFLDLYFICHILLAQCFFHTFALFQKPTYYHVLTLCYLLKTLALEFILFLQYKNILSCRS